MVYRYGTKNVKYSNFENCCRTSYSAVKKEMAPQIPTYLPLLVCLHFLLFYLLDAMTSSNFSVFEITTHLSVFFILSIQSISKFFQTFCNHSFNPIAKTSGNEFFQTTPNLSNKNSSRVILNLIPRKSKHLLQHR